MKIGPAKRITFVSENSDSLNWVADVPVGFYRNREGPIKPETVGNEPKQNGKKAIICWIELKKTGKRFENQLKYPESTERSLAMFPYQNRWAQASQTFMGKKLRVTSIVRHEHSPLIWTAVLAPLGFLFKHAFFQHKYA